MADPSGQNLKLIMTTTLDPTAQEELQKTVESKVVNQNIADLPLIATRREKRMDIEDCYLMQPEWLTSVPQIGKEKVKDKLFFFFKQFVRDL